MAEENSSDVHKYEYVLYSYNNSESNRGLPSKLVSSSTPEESCISEKWNGSFSSADVQQSTSVKLEVDSDSSSAMLKMIHEPVENLRAFSMSTSDFVSPYGIDMQAKPSKEMPERQYISRNIENSELDSTGMTKRPNCNSAGLEDHWTTEASDDCLRAHATRNEDYSEHIIIKAEPQNEPLYTISNAAEHLTVQSSDVDANLITDFQLLRSEIKAESLIENNTLVDAKTEANILESDACIPNKGVSSVKEATMKTGGLLLLENKLEGEMTEASEKNSFFIGDVEITQSDWEKFNRQLHAQILGNQNKDNLLQCVEGETNNYCFMCKRVFKNLQAHMRIHRQKCHICNRIFRHQMNLKTHLKSHDVNSFVRQQPNTCEICLRTFQSKSNFKRHLQQHIIYPYMCKLCRKFFKNVDEFTEHTLTCQKERPHVCQLCNKGFFDQKTLSGHAINCHSVSTVNTCLICGKIYQTKYGLKKHIQRHVYRKSYQCPHCSDVYHREDVYKVHLTEHSEGKDYICCSLCNKVLRPSNLSRHMSLCHTKKCCICKNVFKDRGSLRNHMRKHNIHVDVNCEICMKHFNSEHNYRAHKRGHHTDAFRCHICHKRLYDHPHLHHHLHAKHKENFPLTCGFCNKEFQNVTKHSCQICRKIFSRKVKLWTHNPKQKVTCEICNETFSRDGLLCHKIFKHLRRPFKCEFCNEQFKHLNDLKVHRCCIHKKRKSKKQEDSDVRTRISASKLTQSTTKHEHDEESDSKIEESVIMSQELGVRTEESVSRTEKSASRNKEPVRRLQVLPKDSESDWSFSERRDFKEECGQKDKMNMSLKETSAEKKLLNLDLCAPVRQNDQAQKTEVKINAEVGKNEELPFACKSCDKRFRYLLQLKQHVKQKNRITRQLKGFVKC